VGQEVLVAADGLAGAVGTGLAGGFGASAGGAAGRGDRVAAFGRLLVGEGQGCPGAAQVPGEVGGEHADQHVPADPVFEPVVDRPQVQVISFEGPEIGAFLPSEVLVGGDRGGTSRSLAGTLVRMP